LPPDADIPKGLGQGAQATVVRTFNYVARQA
jgi:hypothetical protein